MKNNLMRREIQRMIKNGVYIEVEVTSNSFALVLLKNEKLNFEEKFENYGEIRYMDLDICRQFVQFFNNKWLIITGFHVYKRNLEEDDMDIVQKITLEDIYNYLNISNKSYSFDDDGEVIYRQLEDYHFLLLESPLDVFKAEVDKMNKLDFTQLFNIAVILWQSNNFNNMNKAKILEEKAGKIDFFLIG